MPSRIITVYYCLYSLLLKTNIKTLFIYERSVSYMAQGVKLSPILTG